MTIVFLIVFGLVTQQETPPNRPAVPKDSIELVITGCLKGRLLAVSDVRRPDVESGPDIRAKSFRLAGKGDVMNDVKRENHHLVEVTGLVKRSALTEPGIKIGKRITIGGGPPVTGTGTAPSPSEFVPVLDISSLRLRSTSCSGG
jgi:hypothetical protein